jgi:hypothetical protein
MAVSGITFIAYKHPELYEKQFFPKIILASGFVLCVVASHDTGISSALKELRPYLQDGAGDQIKKAIANAEIPSVVALGAFGILIYSLLLSWLADHMQNEYSEKKDEDSKDEPA